MDQECTSKYAFVSSSGSSGEQELLAPWRGAADGAPYDFAENLRTAASFSGHTAQPRSCHDPFVCRWITTLREQLCFPNGVIWQFALYLIHDKSLSCLLISSVYCITDSNRPAHNTLNHHPRMPPTPLLLLLPRSLPTPSNDNSRTSDGNGGRAPDHRHSNSHRPHCILRSSSVNNLLAPPAFHQQNLKQSSPNQAAPR